MDDFLISAEEKMEKAVETMERRFSNVRAGRANPAILDGVMVNYYGTPTPLKSLATISIPEARQLMIKPFDKSSLSGIEKGIYEANVGLTPNNNGECIILNIPALTEDTRKEYVKEVKQIAEDCRINLRTIRQDVNNDIKKSDDYTEDEKDSVMEDIQKLIDKYNKIVNDKLSDKEKELLSV
ncbi:MAG: ribosome recycling factor [Bacilli bacterium]|nr:ribosome recycling factor [Bacilli bacterium]